jgi:tetratricopeptide (TPR) repeat protein
MPAMDDVFRSCIALGVPPDATRDEVKRAYRDLVRQWHPDRMGADEARRKAAEERLRELNRAYETVTECLESPPGPQGAPRPANPAYEPTGWAHSVAEQGRVEGSDEDDRSFYHRAILLHLEGMDHYRARRWREAVSALMRSVYLVQDNPEAYLALGRAHRRLGQPAKSEAAFREAARLRPGSAEAHHELGETHLALRDRQAADRQAGILDRLDPGLAALLRESIARSGI